MDDAAAAATARRWVQWEEVVVSNDRGRRLVHYYLRGEPGAGAGGGEERELAVVGRERSPRHMSYAVQGRFLRSLAAAGDGSAAPSPSQSPAAAAEGAPRKWRSRREVVDWLSSLVSGCNDGTYSMANRFHGNSYDDIDVDFVDVAASMDVSTTPLVGNSSKDLTWLGPAWHCQKRWKHYRSFCRRGITISVHNFVYIMSEEKKRLIAYVEDLYEDSNALNMVIVRWFDKVDEVGVELPPNVDDREIFFSHGLQDLNVECIDGLAAVLSAQHFEKFQSGMKHSYWQPYLCRRQINNDDVKPFDITQLQGYWSQELLKAMFNAGSSLKRRLPSGGFLSDSVDLDHSLQKQLNPGCHAEILSQDSGIRGCWFRCSILKRHRDKIKVRYQDLQNADDTGNLEEWVLLTRIANPDQLGIRISGRPMVRPRHVMQDSKDPCSIDIGALVDAWWNSGWWEGIVLQCGNDGRLQVYFPGEKRVAYFGICDLRQSLEWVGDRWIPLKERKDIMSHLPPTPECEDGAFSKLVSQKDSPSTVPESGERCDEKSLGNKISRGQKRVLADLTNDLKLDNLKWMARKRSRRCSSKRQSGTSSGSSSQGDMEESSPCGINSVPDEEVCKSNGEPIFIGLPVSSLVISRRMIEH
ncbi:uncharacterized protein LOC124680836 [Lolium rigidum]|uniref:uncharacterized protein LOC124680836 n=1 Tax=Lolium rigidum TaxID=89674 RepID=UPI001F5D85FF|nr:uncharacterized protein LOC124680836 [Lolium rigidum]